MFAQKFVIEDSTAATLSAEDVCENHSVQVGMYSRTHADGWTIAGNIHEDYYSWVNAFEASHPDFGRVWGDFEDEVFADSEEGYAAFCASHPVQIWDYYDI